MWFLSTYHKNKGIWWYLPSWNWSPNTSLGETLLDILGDGIDQVTWSDYRKNVDLHHNQHTRNYMASLLQEVRSLLEEHLLNKWCIYSSKCWSHRVLHGMKHLIPPTAMATLHQLVGELPPKDFSGSTFVFFGSVKLTMESIDLYFFAFHKSRFNSFHPSVSYSYLLQTLRKISTIPTIPIAAAFFFCHPSQPVQWKSCWINGPKWGMLIIISDYLSWAMAIKWGENWTWNGCFRQNAVTWS